MGPCQHQPAPHPQWLPTIGVGVAACIFAVLLEHAFRRRLWIAAVLVGVGAGAAAGEFAAFKTYVYPNVQYACTIGRPCRPDPQPHVNWGWTIGWGSAAAVLAGAIAADVVLAGREADQRARGERAVR
jgi:hypothetical protein